MFVKKPKFELIMAEILKRGLLGDYVFTPFNLCRDLVNRVPDIEHKKILIIRSVEFLYVLKETLKVNLGDVYFHQVGGSDNVERMARDLGVNIIKELKDDMKFDIVLGNPPYSGVAALHQQFFNKSVELLRDGGEIVFIQPDSAYTSKKPRQKASNLEMMENIKKYKTSVKFVEGTVFESAAVATSLSITHLTKVEDSQISVEYANGDKYDHIELENINKLGVEPETYHSIKTKIENYISKNGCLQDIVFRGYDGIKKSCFKISEIRGHPGDDDFYTFVSNDEKYHELKYCEIGILINKDEYKSLYSYLKTFISRFALSIYKTNTNQIRGFGIVPLVPFDRIWTDEMLAKEICITDKELQEIRKILPDYHGLLNG